MKVKKEQFLLPKANTVVNASSGRWVQAITKPCDVSKTVAGTPVSTQPLVEGLPSGLVAKLKTGGEILISGFPPNQMIWQQQNDRPILRQALADDEKDVKCEEKASKPVKLDHFTQVETRVVPKLTSATSLLAFSAVTPQHLTPIPASQVIKMNNYQLILPSNAAPATCHDKRKITTTPQAVTSLPPIKPKPESGIVFGNQQLTFTPLRNVNILGHNPFPTFVFKDGKGSLSENITPGNTVAQNALPKKPRSKTVSKTFKVRKKPVQTRKIMLKPACSLLTQTALDHTNQDCKESQSKNVSQDSTIPIDDKSLNLGADVNTKICVNQISVVSTLLPVKATSTILTTPGNVGKPDSDVLPKAIENNLNNDNCSESIDYIKNTNDDEKEKESKIVYDVINVDLMDCSVTNDTMHLYSDTSNVEQTVILSPNGLLIPEVKESMETDTQVTDIVGCKTTLNHATSELKENDSNVQNIIDLTRGEGEDFNGDQMEAILLSSDIEHDEEHHTQEYTDNILSQLSNSGSLPNMSCSQVSSVLNALSSSEKSVMNVSSVADKPTKKPVKCEPMEFVNIENVQSADSVRIKVKPSVPKYRICELNQTRCFRCVSCMFLSLKGEAVEEHWIEHHKSLLIRPIDKQSKRQIRCIGCSNVFCSKYALQIHLICDHNVATTEVHELIAVTISANRSQSESKKQPPVRTAIPECNGEVEEPEASKTVSIDLSSTPPPDPEYQPNVPALTPEFPEPGPGSEPELIAADVVQAELPKDNEQKLTSDQELEMPPTPSFGLFTKILENNDKEDSTPQVTPFPSTENESKKLVMYRKLTKCIRRHKTTRNKMRPDFASEVKLNYRCMVEHCGVCVSSMDNLSYHFRCHQTDSDMFFCPECDFSVFNWSSLTPHLWREHKIDIDLYSCKQCSYKSNSYSKLINNHIKIHGDERPFLCDICGKGFKTTKQLRNHKGIHRARRKYICGDKRNGETENIELNNSFTDYICNVCSRSFADSRILKHHTENVHNKARPYLCTFCPHAASSKSSLQMHVRQHTGEKPFSCDECAYVTSDHNSLRRHKMRHTGKRPYQCPHCTYNCIQATTYKSHLKNKHPGLDEGLMFSCPMCPFRTIKKDNYLAHKAEHDLGGDPRSRRKKPQLSTENVQEQPTSVCKTNTTNTSFPEQTDVTALLDHTSMAAVQAHGSQLIVPEASHEKIL